MSILDAFDLTGQTALVTGSKRGIGKAIALALAEAGADIIGVSANLDPAKSEIGDAVAKLGRKFTGYACEFGDRDALKNLAAKVQDDHPQIDILVNNAGTIRRAPAAEHEDAIWDEVIEVNLSAQFILTREIGRGMLERGRGKIIFTASLLTFQGGITVPGYAASKGGIGQLTKAFANEWAGKGIGVNAIAPGYVATDSTEGTPQRSRAVQVHSGKNSGRSLGNTRRFRGRGTLSGLLCVDYTHGTILTVDGGWMGR